MSPKFALHKEVHKARKLKEFDSSKKSQLTKIVQIPRTQVKLNFRIKRIKVMFYVFAALQSFTGMKSVTKSVWQAVTEWDTLIFQVINHSYHQHPSLLVSLSWSNSLDSDFTNPRGKDRVQSCCYETSITLGIFLVKPSLDWWPTQAK